MSESTSLSSDSSSSSTTLTDTEEAFLKACRNGDLELVIELLKLRDNEKVFFDISCKGKSKSNLGWTPLHLATYFGHKEVMEILLSKGADINAINEMGDTCLHKAAFIGRQDIVMLLLQHDADVKVINGEGRIARHMTPKNEIGDEIKDLLRAAEATETLRMEGKFLKAARDGNIEMLNALLKCPYPPNINCVDAQGNSSLHCVAYRGHKEMAVLLLQNGIDTNIKNNRGQLAIDLARDQQTLQVLSVKSVRKVHKTVVRLEGPLLKRSRFLGWKPVWAVLERGVLHYFNTRAEAANLNDSRRRDYKYLDSARVTASKENPLSFFIHFNDGATHRLSIIKFTEDSSIERQRWLNGIQEHVNYSTHYLWGIEKPSETDDYENVAKPLGSMAENLARAKANFDVLESQLNDACLLVQSLEKNVGFKDGQLSSSIPSVPLAAVMRFKLVAETATSMLFSLQHCLTLFHQQEDVRIMQLKQEQEKSRVLEEALNVLAQEHHELEQTVVTHLSEHGSVKSLNSKFPRFYETDDDEFHDAFDADSDSDTLVTAGSVFNSPSQSMQDLNEMSGLAPYDPLVNNTSAETDNRKNRRRASDDSSSSSTNSSDDTLNAVSMASSCDTYISQGGDAYKCARSEFTFQRPPKMDVLVDVSETGTFQSRTSLPVPMFSRNDFSIWSVLKNCIGKELSKITMPVIFNEPLSFLQRMTEYMEYAKLLRIASEHDDPVERMIHVAGFAVSALASNWERLGKPFNPLLGETFELDRPEFRILCEQVSHHPPVSAFHADSPNFTFHGSIHPKLKFWGKSVEIQPKGVVTVELPKWNEAYTWTNVNCCVHNIIVGKLWMEQYGTMEVVNHSNGLRAVLTFKPAGWASKDLHRVEGFIIDKDKKKLHFLYGKWTEFIKCTDINSYDEYMKENSHKFKRDERSKSPNESPAHTPRKVLSKLNSLKMSSFRSLSIQEPDESIPDPPEGEIPKCDSTYSIDIPRSFTVWEADPRPPNTSEFYQFTLFAMSLNEMKPGKAICPTDSRLRPDIRKLESGDIDGAALEKTRLEEKQRDARKSKKSKKGDDFVPRWFNFGTNPHTKQDDWLYTGGYWDRNYEVSDIF
ncbi:oxysterol-binding protein-related protein 1 isoform X2 [Bradysia coprophila]|uniref:oxysterol-binding protein-related protein 1 isoform X2 n=1 Tax=Bradysia coprophila TaxID=38358 RepID=UPI00187D85D6|nr:oxysterol-binding protein-related protein 1 isoform X2 [Bradysia coprophila]